MAKLDFIEVQGRVIEVLPNATFRIKLDTGQNVRAYPSGKMRQRHIKILAGDRIVVAVSAYDLTMGRITDWLKREAA